MCHFRKLYLNICRLPGMFLIGSTDSQFLLWNYPLVGFPKIEAADHKDTYNCAKACSPCLSWRRNHWLLSRTMDTPNDHILRPCVSLYFFCLQHHAYMYWKVRHLSRYIVTPTTTSARIIISSVIKCLMPHALVQLVVHWLGLPSPSEVSVSWG